MNFIKPILIYCVVFIILAVLEYFIARKHKILGLIIPIFFFAQAILVLFTSSLKEQLILNSFEGFLLVWLPFIAYGLIYALCRFFDNKKKDVRLK